MAKLVFLFVLAFVFVQCSFAGKIKRDAPPAGVPTQENFEEALQKMQEFFKQTFSQEKLEEISGKLKELGNNINTATGEFLKKTENK